MKPMTFRIGIGVKLSGSQGELITRSHSWFMTDGPFMKVEGIRWMWRGM